MQKKINIGIISGGFSNERAISKKTGRQIAKALPREKYNVFDIEIAQNRNWILKDKKGKPLSFKRTSSSRKSKQFPLLDGMIQKKIDVAFIALHGKYGEDGKIQAIFDLLEIPYTGSGVLASALGMNKNSCLEVLKKHQINFPPYFYLKEMPSEITVLKNKIKKKIGFPCIVKPNESGSSVGISLAKEKDFFLALKKAFREDSSVLVQKFIQGKELTCGVMGNNNQNNLLALPLVEIIPHQSSFFDYQAKYFSSSTEEVCPALIDSSTTRKIKELAKKIHRILGCDGLTRSDFIWGGNRQIYFLEINTIPGQTEASLCPKEAAAAGINFSDFLMKQIELALEKNKK